MAFLQARRGGTAARPGSQAADLTETGDAYVAEVELPGVRQDDINVELSGQELVIGGEYREPGTESWALRRDRREGRFDFRMMLPGKADPDKIAVALADGVLTVTVPKAGSRWQGVMEEQGLITAVRRRDGYVLVTVSGEIDITTAGQLRGRLEGPADGGQRVIVDFSRVSFIDAAGARVLAGAAARAQARGGSLQLVAAGRQVRRVLALTGLHRSIPLAATVAEARAALRSDPNSRANGVEVGVDRA